MAASFCGHGLWQPRCASLGTSTEERFHSQVFSDHMVHDQSLSAGQPSHNCMNRDLQYCRATECCMNYHKEGYKLLDERLCTYTTLWQGWRPRLPGSFLPEPLILPYKVWILWFLIEAGMRSIFGPFSLIPQQNVAAFPTRVDRTYPVADLRLVSETSQGFRSQLQTACERAKRSGH